MSAVLRALEERAATGNPIRVGVVGAGFAGRGFVARVLRRTSGMRVVAVANRTVSEAERAYRDGGVDDLVRVDGAAALGAAIAAGRPAVTDDPTLLTDADEIDVIVEATGEVEFGAGVAIKTIDAGKDLVLINAELDSTLGPLLKTRADAAGVILTDMAGDQPAVIMDLIDEVTLLGFRPILAGNIKSLLDHRRTPETQRAFAEAVGQRPKMITSFADGTKIAAEMGVVANATGFGVAVRGMAGPRAERVEQAPEMFDLEALLERPVVDYLIGAEPSFGIFVLGYEEDPLTRHYMKFYKMGDGPVYTFYRPFHLGPLETVQSVARAVLLRDPAITPLAGARYGRGRTRQARPPCRGDPRRDRRVHRLRHAREQRHSEIGGPAPDGTLRRRGAGSRHRLRCGDHVRRCPSARRTTCDRPMVRTGRTLRAGDPGRVEARRLSQSPASLSTRTIRASRFSSALITAAAPRR